MDVANFSEYDSFLYHQGTHRHAYEMFGAHLTQENGVQGTRFTVWAPHAQRVSVVGDFNHWNQQAHLMQRLPDGESWSLFIPEIKTGMVYKYALLPQSGGGTVLKADPYGFYAEVKPHTASKVYDLTSYRWQDGEWYERKRHQHSYSQPMLIYEVHLGSWRRTLEGDILSYRDFADQLVQYAKEMHYTHIELLPLCEHPFDGSWGYQATGYYAVTSRYGSPDEFRYFVDQAHQQGIGIIMDWVPGHFCKDAHGLRQFDGQNLYESDNCQLAENKGWGTLNFDYGRTEVQSFLISNALFWLEEYHIDGLRIDAVANMLYLNYGREDGEWQPNKYGQAGNLEAMEFLRRLNSAVFAEQPQALMIAEESTSWPLISRPVESGGIGFNYKWNMGWMNDMLDYMSLDPIYRKWNQDKLTFSLMYAFSENFVLPLSHDEVVHGKRSLIGRMPGDYWQQFAGLRVFFAYWMAHPGKKMLFMGGEFGQFIEWKFDDSLDWHLIEQYPMHAKMQEYSRELNQLYCRSKALWQVDFDWNGFEWIDCKDQENSIVSFIRKADDREDFLVVLCNFTPETHQGYRIGMPKAGIYQEIFNSDAEKFGGSGVVNTGNLKTEAVPWHDRAQSLVLTIPPLAAVYLRWTGSFPEERAVEPLQPAVVLTKPKTVRRRAKKVDAEPAEEKPKAVRSRTKKAGAAETEEKPKAVRSRTKKAGAAETEEKPKAARSRTKKAGAAETEEKPKAARSRTKKAGAAEAEEKPKAAHRRTKKKATEGTQAIRSRTKKTESAVAEKKPRAVRTKHRVKTDKTEE